MPVLLTLIKLYPKLDRDTCELYLPGYSSNSYTAVFHKYIENNCTDLYKTYYSFNIKKGKFNSLDIFLNVMSKLQGNRAIPVLDSEIFQKIS